MLILIFIVIIMVILYLIYVRKNTIVVEGLNTFNGRMAIDDQYFYDKLFDDVIYYPNEHKESSELEDIVTTGWVRCKMECPGHCVEYGQTSNAYCFPY